LRIFVRVFGCFFSLVIACGAVAQNVAPAPLAGKPLTPTVPVATPAQAASAPAPVVPPSDAHSLEKADLEAYLDGVIPLQLERSDLAGAVVMVMRGDDVLLKKGYGYADAKKKTPVDPDATLFRLASISKLFTWVSVMQLVEQGKLDLDTDVNQYLDFKIEPAFGKPVTLRELMTHTSGFEEQIESVLQREKAKPFALRDYLVRYQPKRIYPPGTVGAYSNYGVGLAGYIVQRTSGEKFEDYVRRHIFDPLGMKHSTFDQPAGKDLYGSVSDGYTATAKPAVGFEVFNPMPAGGISTTAGDMSRFARALMNGGALDGQRILKPETVQLMWTRQFSASPSMPAMDMGFYEVQRNGLKFVGHNGDLAAFHSQFEIEPEKKLVYFISYNSAGSDDRGSGTARPEVFEGLLNRYFPYTPKPNFQKLTDADRQVAGTYVQSRREDSTRLKLESLMDQAHASIDKDGELEVDSTKDRRGHVIHYKPLGGDLWQDKDGQGKLFAVRNSHGRVVRLAGMFAGAQMVRVPWWENAKFIGVAGIIALVACLFAVIAIIARQYKRWFRKKAPVVQLYPGSVMLTRSQRWAAALWLLAIPGVALVLALSVGGDPFPDFAKFPRYFLVQDVLVVLALLASIPAVIATLRMLRRPGVRFASKLKYGIIGASYVVLAYVSLHWHLLGSVRKY